MKIELALHGNLDDSGKINPLVMAIDKYRASAVNLATRLYLTPQSRKDLKAPKKTSDDQDAWNKVLSKK